MYKRISSRRAKALRKVVELSSRPHAANGECARDKKGPDPYKSCQKRVVFYDLETSIVAKARKHEPFCTNIKGMKRRNLIVEIGAVDINVIGTTPASTTFHRLVDPRLTNMTLADTLQITNQNVSRTLMYWNKLFSQKKMLKKMDKTVPIEDQLAVFEQLFDQEEFVTTKRALSQFFAFCLGRQQIPDTPLLVAHAGKSFDHQIVRAFLHRLHLPQFGNYMVDSLPVARRILPRLKSHSLGKLHEKLIGTDFDFAHHAMADAHALCRVCKALADCEGLMHVSYLWSDVAADLTHIRGIGPRTSKSLRLAGYDTATLRACVLANEECPQPLKKMIRNHKSLWKGLRKKWSTPAALQTNSSKTLTKEKLQRLARKAKVVKEFQEWKRGRTSYIHRSKLTNTKRCKSV